MLATIYHEKCMLYDVEPEVVINSLVHDLSHPRLTHPWFFILHG